MIPAKFLSKIGIHELEIEGVKVKVSHVTDNFSVIDHKINQLRASLNKQKLVVGIDIKVTVDQKQKSQNSDLLILFGGNCCSVIKLDNNLIINFPSSILNLLADNNICVVGRSNSMKLSRSNVSRSISLSGVVEVGQLAARVLKKPNLSKCGLEELDKEIRQTVKDSKANVATSLPGTGAEAATCPNWKAMVFSDEEIKYAIHDAYTCGVIGDKLLRILDAVTL